MAGGWWLVLAGCWLLTADRLMADSWWVGSRKRYCPSDLPLRSIPPTALRLWAPPAYGRGWPGSFRTTPPTTCNFNPFLLRCASLVGTARLRPRVARVRRTTPPTTLQLQSIPPPLRFACKPRPLTAAVARVRRTTPLTTLQLQSIPPPLR